MARGDSEGGRRGLSDYDIDPGWVCRWAPWLVQADLDVGDSEAAREHARRAVDAAGIGLAGPWAAATRAHALVALADGDREAAHHLAVSAADRAESVGARLEVARSLVVAGRAVVGTDRETAVAHLESAATTAAEAGATGVRDEAVRELRRLGRRIGRGGGRTSPGAQGVPSLSARERDVAELVAQGLTNKDIAARLYLSPKTVESHLARAFDKLDVRTRAALVARLGDVSSTLGTHPSSAGDR